MITNIAITNFKCFNNRTDIPLSSINLLTGINGRGKSTALQSLLLMRQSIEHNEYSKSLILNGNLVNLGSCVDIKNVDKRPGDPILLSFTNQHGSIEYELESADIMKYELPIVDVRLNTISTFSENSNLCNLIPTTITEDFGFRRIHYIAADRLGPQSFYKKRSLGNFPNTGPHGEFVANVLELLGEKSGIINDDLCINDGVKTVIGQTEEWLKEILGKATIELKGLDDDSPVLTLLMNCCNSVNKFKPSNIGFGYSYILPIIVSGLIAKPDEILIVENPEAHLHPSAQSKIAFFLAKIAKTGVQVLIESHSDHILNGLRISVNEDLLDVEDLKVLFFQDRAEQIVEDLTVRTNGDIEEWPDGFFDQQEIDLQRLMGLL